MNEVIQEEIQQKKKQYRQSIQNELESKEMLSPKNNPTPINEQKLPQLNDDNSESTSENDNFDTQMSLKLKSKMSKPRASQQIRAKKIDQMQGAKDLKQKIMNQQSNKDDAF